MREFRIGLGFGEFFFQGESGWCLDMAWERLKLLKVCRFRSAQNSFPTHQGKSNELVLVGAPRKKARFDLSLCRLKLCRRRQTLFRRALWNRYVMSKDSWVLRPSLTMPKEPCTEIPRKLPPTGEKLELRISSTLCDEASRVQAP